MSHHGQTRCNLVLSPEMAYNQIKKTSEEIYLDANFGKQIDLLNVLAVLMRLLKILEVWEVLHHWKFYSRNPTGLARGLSSSSGFE